MPDLPKTGVVQAFNERAKARDWPFQCHTACEFERPELNSAYALWQQKAAGRPMPSRADMTARDLKPFLTQISLLEQVDSGGAPCFRVRLHGTALARYAGDSTGEFLSEIVEPPRFDAYRGLYEVFLVHGAPLRVVSRYQAPEIAYLIGETLLAPLSVPDSRTPMILSVTYAKPRIEMAAQAAGPGSQA